MIVNDLNRIKKIKPLDLTLDSILDSIYVLKCIYIIISVLILKKIKSISN